MTKNEKYFCTAQFVTPLIVELICKEIQNIGGGGITYIQHYLWFYTWQTGIIFVPFIIFIYIFGVITILRGTISLMKKVQKTCEILISLVQLDRNLITYENFFIAVVIQNLQIASPALW